MCVGAPREGALIKLSTISVGALKRGSVERAYKYVAKSVRGSKLLALTVRVKKYETAKLIFDAMNHFLNSYDFKIVLIFCIFCKKTRKQTIHRLMSTFAATRQVPML